MSSAPQPLARKRSFSPVTDATTRILILGSLPGERSLAEQQYYANPGNAFWRLIGAVIGADLVGLAYLDRLNALRARRIGLWDVVQDARREGSLDSRIRDHAPNDLPALLATLPDLKAIAFNGETSARIGLPRLGADRERYAILRLPSSSGARAMPAGEKLAAWLALRAFL